MRRSHRQRLIDLVSIVLTAAPFAFATWRANGLAGVAFAASAIVFRLLLTFKRTVRVVKNAADAPVGRVPSAERRDVPCRLARGTTALKIVTQTTGHGRKVEGATTPGAGATTAVPASSFTSSVAGSSAGRSSGPPIRATT